MATVWWAGPTVDGNMGCVSYSSVDWILLMGGVGGAEERELLEASTCIQMYVAEWSRHDTSVHVYTACIWKWSSD